MAYRHAYLSRDEEIVLVKEIGKRQGLLFGKMEGDGCVKIGKIRKGITRGSRCFEYVITVFSHP